MRTLSAIALAALLAAPLHAQSQQRISRTSQLDGNGYFKILLVDGSVRVRAWDRDSVRVEGSVNAAARRGFYFGASGSSGKMGIDASGEGEAELEVSLPRGATVWIKTGAGAIEVTGMEGALDLYSVTGRVSMTGSPRSLRVESMAGDVEVVGSPRSVRVKTGAGDISFRGGTPDLDITTVSGEVTIAAEAPLRRALVESVGGPVSLAAPVDRGGAVTIRTHDGPVELVLPAGTDADVLLATLEGVLTTAQRKLTGKRSGLKGREITFSMGDGGAEITVHTFSGAVTVREPDSP